MIYALLIPSKLLGHERWVADYSEFGLCFDLEHRYGTDNESLEHPMRVLDLRRCVGLSGNDPWK